MPSRVVRGEDLASAATAGVCVSRKSNSRPATVRPAIAATVVRCRLQISHNSAAVGPRTSVSCRVRDEDFVERRRGVLHECRAKTLRHRRRVNPRGIADDRPFPAGTVDT